MSSSTDRVRRWREKRRNGVAVAEINGPSQLPSEPGGLAAEIVFLREEVARLKQELAATHQREFDRNRVIDAIKRSRSDAPL